VWFIKSSIAQHIEEVVRLWEGAAEQGHAKAQERIKEIIANRHE